jgi:hypothetical protein
VGELFVDDVGVDQAGYVDHAVVHRAALGPPRYVVDEAVEDVVGADHEVAQHVDPRAAGEGGPLGSGKRSHPGDGGHAAAEEAALEVHADTVRRDRTDVRHRSGAS